MTKTEQNRVLAWRLKLLQEASAVPRNVAYACRHFGRHRKRRLTRSEQGSSERRGRLLE
jgi:hypothetical protein